MLSICASLEYNHFLLPYLPNSPNVSLLQKGIAVRSSAWCSILGPVINGIIPFTVRAAGADERISSCAGVFYGAVREVSVLLLRRRLPGGDAPLQMQRSWAAWICWSLCKVSFFPSCGGSMSEAIPRALQLVVRFQHACCKWLGLQGT